MSGGKDSKIKLKIKAIKFQNEIEGKSGMGDIKSIHEEMNQITPYVFHITKCNLHMVYDVF